MPLLRLLTLACVLAAPALACAATWDKVGETSLASVYIDKDSMRRNGAEVRAALEWRWNSPTEVPDTGGVKTYRLERQVQISNCTNRGYAVAEGMRYADARGTDLVSSYKYEEQSLPYLEASPKTIRDTIIGHVCKAAPQAKAN
ncbi:MAG: surface-adhesin E family protein [Caldimonas sp.]